MKFLIPLKCYFSQFSPFDKTESLQANMPLSINGMCNISTFSLSFNKYTAECMRQ